MCQTQTFDFKKQKANLNSILSGEDMAGSPIARKETRNEESSLITIPDHWEVQYSRFFNYSSSTNSTTSLSTPLSANLKKRFKGNWLSTSAAPSPGATLRLFTDNSSGSGSILTVSFLGKVLEEHFISKLHFTWPQVTCVSGFPARGSLVLFVSYKDCAGETQKFALRFSAFCEVKAFMASLEDLLLNKKDVGNDIASEFSSHSELIPPYRPAGISSPIVPIDSSEILEMTPICVSHASKRLRTEVKQLAQPKEVDQQFSSQDAAGNSNSNGRSSTFPLRFTSLVTNCQAEKEEGDVAAASAATCESIGIKSQIAKYMQDASFLDMLSKVEKVMTEMGGGD